MQVFKTYFKVMWKNKAQIIVYVAVFVVFAILFVASDTTAQADFEAEKLNVAVINRDDSSLSRAVKEHMGKVCNLTELPDEKERLQDELFYRNVDTIILLPAGFGDGFASGTGKAEVIKASNSAESYAGERLLSSFLETLGRYLSAGYSLEDAVKNAEQDGAVATPVNMLDTGALTESEFQFTALFRFMGYSLLALMILSISTIMLTFFEKDLRNRCDCSPFSMRKQSVQLLLAAGVFMVAVWLIFGFFSLVMYGFDLFFSPYWWICMLNALIYTLVCSSVGFCVGVFCTNASVQSAAANVISLAAAFLGGTFVPLEMMGEGMRKVGAFLPTYWYVILTEKLKDITHFTAAAMKPVWQCLLIQLGFAAAILCISLLVSRERARQA